MGNTSWKHGALRATALLLTLVTFSYAAASSASLGTLRTEGAVFVGGEKASAETSLFSGDRISTSNGHAIVSLTSGLRLVMDRDSSAALTSAGSGVTLGMEKGRLAVLSNPRSSLQIETDGLSLIPSGASATLAEVAMLHDGSLTVSVHKGAVTVRNLRADPVEVAAGRIITVSPRFSQTAQPKSQPIGTGAHGKMTLGEKLRTFQIGHLSHAASAGIVFGAIGGAAATAIIVPLTVGTESSPTAP